MGAFLIWENVERVRNAYYEKVETIEEAAARDK